MNLTNETNAGMRVKDRINFVPYDWPIKRIFKLENNSKKQNSKVQMLSVKKIKMKK